jgi:uncharacterized surface protein with fasciclin (FAS1) repeats
MCAAKHAHSPTYPSRFVVLAGFEVVPDICAKLDFSTVTSVSNYPQRRLPENGGALCDPSILDAAKELGDLSMFLELLEIADLTEVFSCAGPFTLLAPTNAAFEALDVSTIKELLLPDNKEKLQDLLLYHMLQGMYLEEDFEDGPYDTLLAGQPVDVSINPVVFNGRAPLVDGDNLACNGVIHVIGDVLVPGKCRLMGLINSHSKTFSANVCLNYRSRSRQAVRVLRNVHVRRQYQRIQLHARHFGGRDAISRVYTFRNID